MPDPRRKGRSAHKLEGENLFYFFMRIIFTGTLFIIVTLCSGIWRISNLSDVFSDAFILLIFILIFIYGITGFVGRLTAYFLLKWSAKLDRKSIKTFANINRGMNKMGMRWFISIIIKSFLYALGIVVLLQNAIYGTDTFFTLVATYIIVEIFINLILRSLFWLRG